MKNPNESPIDPDELMEAVEESMFGTDNPGFCTECGEQHDGCEPDARNYPCEVNDCGNYVFGAEELMMMGYGA